MDDIKKFKEYLDSKYSIFNDEFYKNLETKKMKLNQILDNTTYNLNGENSLYLSNYYSLIYLSENSFENFEDLKKSLMIEELELEKINLLIENGKTIEEIKLNINKELKESNDYFKKNFDLCSNVYEIKQKLQNYYNSIRYIKEMFKDLDSDDKSIGSSGMYGR